MGEITAFAERAEALVMRLLHEKNKLERAIESAAYDPGYDEMKIRKAVSFELAELIVEARRRVT
jgi:hypothetical protein